LTFWSRHETFIRISWYSVLPDLDATINYHIKILVVIYEFLYVNRFTNQINLFIEIYVDPLQRYERRWKMQKFGWFGGLGVTQDHPQHSHSI